MYLLLIFVLLIFAFPGLSRLLGSILSLFCWLVGIVVVIGLISALVKW